jgi:WD40 repeat protein/serine/threonine protein kinase
MGQNEDHIEKEEEDLSRTLDGVPPWHAIGGSIGGYKLLSILGEGGFGMVYLAEQQQPIKRLVALKVIKPGMDTKQVVARFETERQALALLDHPHIAQVFDAGATEAGRPYFAMEYVKGIPITQYCDKYKLGTAERLRLFIPLCQAIQHAHLKGIIHRDIKPSNALVMLQEEKPIPKVIDFGVAKALHQRLTEKTLATEKGEFIGTPEYMSPEQAELTGLDVDTRTDVYSLGVLLYELLTGCTPFDPADLRSKGYAQMQRIICEQDPVKPSTRLTTLGGQAEAIARQRSATTDQLRKAVRGDLDWIVMKAMEKDRTRRYETASGLAQDLERHLNNEPVWARPPSTLYRFQKLVRRNKGVFAGVAAVAAVLVIGLAVSTVSLVREQYARRIAVAAQEREARLREQAQTQAYASDMSRAQLVLAENDLGRARDLLNRHRPKPGVKDLRGWEWRYLWQQCQSDASFTLCQKSSPVWSLAVSPSRKWLAIGELDSGRLSVWDLETRQEMPPLPAGGGEVRVAFSPREELLAFSAVTGAALAHPQHKVHLWNGATKQIVAGFELPLGGPCIGLAFSEGGQMLVTYAAGPTNEVGVWRVPTGAKLTSYRVPAWEVGQGTPGTPFAIDRRGTVAAVGPNHTIHLIDLSEGKTRWTRRAADESVKALALSPDGRILASGAGFVESGIRLWDTATGKEISRLQGHRAWVSALAFWPDGKTLASASGDQTIRLWDLTDPVQVPSPRVLRGHNLEVWRLALLPDAKTLVSGSKDGSVCLWDTTTIQHERTRIILPVTVAAWRFAPDSRSVLTVDGQGHVTRWRGADFGERISVMDLAAKRTPVFSSALISREGRWVAAGSEDGIVTVWDLQERTLLRQATVSSGSVVPVEFTDRESRLVVWDANDGSFQERDLATWQRTRSWQGPVSSLVRAAFSADEKLCIMLAEDGTTRLRDMATRRETNAGLDIRQVDVVTFSPDARLFAAASSRGHATLWETATLGERAKFHGFLMGNHAAAFSPDGKRLAVGGDGSEAVKLWDVESYQELLTLEGQGSLIHSSAFSSDGTVIGAINSQGQLHLWRAPSWEEIEAAEKDARDGPTP